MILYDKLKERYDKKELKNVLGDDAGGKVLRGDLNIALYKISQHIYLYSLPYSFEDFLKDYHKKYKHIKEKKMLYNLMMKGYSTSSLRRKYNIESSFTLLLRNGFNYNSMAKNIHLSFEILEIEVDISLFTIDIYNIHIELFGKKEDLENFKEKYNIKYDLYYEPYRKSWHLAFNGCLAKFIK